MPGNIGLKVALIALMVLLAIPSSMPRGAGLVGADLVGTWTESLRDRDGDGLAEGLVLTMDVDVYEPGDYGVFGSIQGILHASSGLVSLPPGRGEIAIVFTGGDIITYRPSGRLDISLQLYTSSPETPVRTMDIMTVDEYDPDMFERGSDFPGTSVTLEGDAVLINNPKVEIRLETTRPKLTFYHPDARDLTMASLECVRMVAFEDVDGDLSYDAEVDIDRYVTDLTRDVDWNMELDLTAGYRIDLQGVAPMRIVGAPTASAWAAVTIALDSTAIGPLGASQKFDITIDLLQSLDADGIAIVQELRDISGNHTFLYSESGPPADPDRSLSMVAEDGSMHGIYLWTESILYGNRTPETPGKAVSSHDIGTSGATVIFSYPLKEGTLFVYHDPTVGIDPDLIVKEPGRNGLENSPLLMAIGLVLGLMVVLGAVAVKRFGRRW